MIFPAIAWRFADTTRKMLYELADFNGYSKQFNDLCRVVQIGNWLKLAKTGVEPARTGRELAETG